MLDNIAVFGNKRFVEVEEINGNYVLNNTDISLIKSKYDVINFSKSNLNANEVINILKLIDNSYKIITAIIDIDCETKLDYINELLKSKGIRGIFIINNKEEYNQFINSISPKTNNLVLKYGM